MTMTLGSLFAGIGGFDLGFERAGFRTVWQCEIDKAAQGVLRRHFPEAKRFSDVREVGAYNLEPVDVITYGSPCQDLSVAGKRAGLAGERSGLFNEAARIIRELREAYGKPEFTIWENVPGAFSSNEGKDFAAVVQTMVNLGARDIAWRVLDSRYFGVAQRRRRVFLVADFGGERAEQILFEPESLRGDTPPRRKARKEAARGAGSCVAGGSYWDGGQLADTLDASMAARRQTMPERRRFAAVLEPVPFDTTQITSPSNFSSPKPGDPCHPLAAGAHPPAVAIQLNGDRDNPGVSVSDGVAFCLPANPMSDRAQAVAFAQNTRDEVRLMGGDGQIAGALAAQPGMKQTTYVAQPIPIQEVGKRTGVSTTDRRAGLGIGDPDDPMFTLQATAQHGVAQPSVPAVSGTLGGGSNTRGWSNDLDRSGAFIPTAAMQVRRLTPTECERLQGFPDGWTAEAVLPDGTVKAQADGPRYKQLGNAVTVSVAEWIARRVAAVLK